MKIKLHFNRVNMQRRDPKIWSAHTSKSCNMSETVEIRYKGNVVGRTIFNPAKKDNPRAWIEFFGSISSEEGKTIIEIR